MENKKLNLGCGPKWKEQYPEHRGLDVIDYGQEFVGDIFVLFSSFYKENDFDEIMANHFLEHFDQDQLKKIFEKAHFMLKKGGVFKFVVPHKKKERAWILSHKSFWNETTVNWLGEEEARETYGFGNWKVEEVVTNSRGDLHGRLIKQ